MEDTDKCTALITAIFQMAVRDSLDMSRPTRAHEARKFLHHSNPLFQYYCELLNMDSEGLSRDIKIILITGITCYRKINRLFSEQE